MDTQTAGQMLWLLLLVAPLVLGVVDFVRTGSRRSS